ncbi:MAG: hypothetical protein LBR97_03935 [Dysgonamonadaceae bacterium]|nr:hypothetical protein [Dysgonamonadaceae bacterium]
MAGGSYATLTVDPLTSAFSVNFSPNNSSSPRNAVVRVTSNCTGEFKDFVFAQLGATCTSHSDPTLNSTALTLCSGGSVFAHVTNAVAGVDYIWTYAGVIVHTGSWMEIKRAGVYKVYTGLLGCGTAATLTVTADASTAPSAIRIDATNRGILCAGENVILTANTTDPVLWYHDGMPLTGANRNDNPLTLSGAAEAGSWFAVATDASGCVSNASNALTLTDNTSASAALTLPQAAVNGQPLTGTLTICKGGTLKLEITNADAFPPGTQYEWFDNGVSIGRGTKPVMYVVAPNTTSMVLWVTASDQSGSCPNTVVSPPVSVTATAPGITSINNGASQAAICGGTPATLIADYAAGTGNYEWMKDGSTVAGADQTLSTTQPGKYTVRYKDSNGCWSVVSTSIDVIQSASLNMSWNLVPANVIKGDQVIYSINSAPVAGQYSWSYNTNNPNAVVSINPIDNGTLAVIQYGGISTLPANTEPDVEIVVKSVGHPCGDVTLEQTIQVKDGCMTGTWVNLTPNGTISLIEGTPTIFSATTNASNNNSDLKYEWFVNGSYQGTSATNTFSYTPVNAGTYTVLVQVTNECTLVGDLTAQATLDVKVDPNNYTLDTSGNFYLIGKNCLDVAQGNFDATCGTQAQRTGDFLGINRDWDPSKAQYTYTFVLASDAPTYINPQFVTDDPSVLIQSETSDIVGKTHTITFNQDVLAKAADKGETSALTITLYALYEELPVGTKKRVELKINVQDCMCACGAYVAANQWKKFMCYNLGVTNEETLDPFIPNQYLHGAKYKFGAKNETLSMTVDQSTPGAITDWTNTTKYPYQTSNNWSTTNDPCPTGYHVPTRAEWEGVINTALNPQTVPSGATWTDNAGNYTSGCNFGGLLFLPAIGSRDYNDGTLDYRGLQGSYWSKTYYTNNTNYAYYMHLSNYMATMSYFYRTQGNAVRCIAN